MFVFRNELKNMKLWEDGMMDKIGTSSDNWKKEKFEENQIAFLQLISTYQEEHKKIKLGGGTIAIERQHNRTRTKRWGPRSMDLDILIYNQIIMDSEDLIIPHPGLKYSSSSE